MRKGVFVLLAAALAAPGSRQFNQDPPPSSRPTNRC